MFFFIVSVLPSASSSLFCLWNHFHTLTAQSLESSPGALCVWFVTTADSPSSRSAVSPSSIGTVLWEDFTCPGLGECPHWARVQAHWWVVSLPQSALTLISPHGETSRSRIQSDWCHSNHIYGACHSLRQKCNIPANAYNKNGVRKLQNMKHGKHSPDVKAPSSPMHTDSILTWVWGSSEPLWLCPDQAPLLKLSFTNVRRNADTVYSKWMLLSSCYHYIIYYKVLIWLAQALNDWS